MSYPLEAQRSLSRRLRLARDPGSRRARLISQIVFPPRDLSRYLNGATHRSPPLPLPSCLVTSHVPRRASPSQRRPVALYPSMVASLRWNPYVEVSTDRLTDETPSPPSERFSASACTSELQRPVALASTQIATFCNQCTMTTHLADFGCGVPKVAWPSTAMRDTDTDWSWDAPHEIRHFGQNLDELSWQSPLQPTTRRVTHEAVRDIDDECRWPSRPGPARSPSRPAPPSPRGSADKCPEPGCALSLQRKMLYNEGISDSVMECVAQEQEEDVSPQFSSRPGAPGARVPPSPLIPHSHTARSRYHQRCQDQPPVFYRGGTTDPGPPRSPRVRARSAGGTTPRTPVAHPPYPPPRKVVPSERDINAYVRQQQQHPARDN